MRTFFRDVKMCAEGQKWIEANAPEWQPSKSVSSNEKVSSPQALSPQKVSPPQVVSKNVTPLYEQLTKKEVVSKNVLPLYEKLTKTKVAFIEYCPALPGSQVGCVCDEALRASCRKRMANW